jgi:hypothetical protein
MALDYESPPPGRRLPYKKKYCDPYVMAVDGQIPTGDAVHEVARSADWDEEAGLHSSDGNDDNKADPAW